MSTASIEEGAGGARFERELPLTEARRQFTELVNRAAYADEGVYVTRHGRRAAAVVPAWVLEELEAAEDRVDAAAVEEARARGEWVGWPDAKRELGL